jgi:hypothetical protein
VTTHLISRMIAQGHIRTPLNREAVGRCEWAFGPIGLLPPEEPRRGRKPFISTTGSEGGYQKVAMLAMCGVHLGPLHSISTSTVIQPYLQWFENAAARELFEFQDTNSAVSLAYQRALGMVLENEVRVLLLASLNDQVVSELKSLSGTSLETSYVCCAPKLRWSTGPHLWRIVLHRSTPFATKGTICRRRFLQCKRLHDESAVFCVHAAQRWHRRSAFGGASE